MIDILFSPMSRARAPVERSVQEYEEPPISGMKHDTVGEGSCSTGGRNVDFRSQPFFPSIELNTDWCIVKREPCQGKYCNLLYFAYKFLGDFLTRSRIRQSITVEL